jgi:hypothetical protein
MRQFLATLALVAAVTAAPLGTYCQWQCARDAAVPSDAAMPHCHDAQIADAPGGTSVASGIDRCDGHDAVPALTEARRLTATSLADTITPALQAAGFAQAQVALVDAFAPPNLSPPPTARLAILRI